MKKLHVFFVVFMAAALLLTACQPKAAPEPTKEVAPVAPTQTTAPVEPTTPPPQPTEEKPVGEQPLKLIMVQHALCAWDAFWCTVEDGIQTAAKQMGVEVTVLGPDKFDLEKTASLIEQAIAAQPDGIGLTVTDPVLFKGPIMKALEAGIPVLAYNAGKGPVEDGIPYMTYLGMDEYQGGYQSGSRLIAAGATKGVCINHQVGHAGLDARCRGLIDAFSEKGLTAEVLGVKGEDAAQAQTTISDFYTANPDVDAFLTLGPSSANPFYAFLEADQPAKAFHITFDLTPEVEAKINDGTTIAAVDQQPFLQGYGAVMYLVLHKRNGISPALPVTATGPGFITKDMLGVAVEPDKPLKLMMVQHALCAWDAFWCTVEDGIQTAAKQMGVEVTVLGPDKFDLEKTASLIEQAIAAQPDGIGLTVTDPVLFKGPIMKALEAGIPVLAYNAGKGPVEDGIPYMTYLGMDEYQGGYQSGSRLIAAGATKGVCINHQVGHAGLDARCRGLIDAFSEKGLTAEVLGVKGEDAAQAQTTISDFYTANPDVDAFLTLGPSSANPFYAFLEADQPAKAFHITFDLTPEVEAKIKDGTTIAAVDQQPFLQGYGAVMYLMLRQRYGITPATAISATGPGFITKDMLGN